MTDSSVESVDTSSGLCRVSVKTPKGVEVIESEIVLSAIGVTANIEGIGLEIAGLRPKREKLLLMIFTKHQLILSMQ